MRFFIIFLFSFFLGSSCGSFDGKEKKKIQIVKGKLEIHAADDFEHGIARHYFFLRMPNGKRFFLNFEDDLQKSQGEFGSEIEVLGFVHGDTLDTKITDIKLLK
jgi:hypothetical protein